MLPISLHCRPLTSLQAYLTRVVPTNDFFFVVLAVSFLSHTPITVVLAPLVITAVRGRGGEGGGEKGVKGG